MTDRIRTINSVRDIGWDLARPCPDCPFRKSSPYHAGVAASIMKVLELIERGRFMHTCHKTDPESDSGEGKLYRGKLQHCVGALFMVVKTGQGVDLQGPLIRAIDAGLVDIHDLDRRARQDRDCYTLEEFVDFNGDNLLRGLEETNANTSGE